MDQNKIDMYVAQYANMLPSQKIVLVRDALSKLDDSKFIYVQSLQYRDPLTMLIISILIGELGIDRFLLGDTAMGVLKLLTCGGCGVWWLVDLIFIQEKTREANYKLLMQTLAIQGGVHVVY